MATPAPNDSKNAIAVAKAMLSTAASVMVVQSVVRKFIPPEFRGFLFSGIRGFLSRFSDEMTMVIERYDVYTQNELFEAAQVFLAAKQSLSMRRVRVTKSTKENHFTLAMDRNQTLVDTFNGIKLKWAFVSRQVNPGNQVHHGSTDQHEVQYFELTFHKKSNPICLPSSTRPSSNGNCRRTLCWNHRSYLYNMFNSTFKSGKGVILNFFSRKLNFVSPSQFVSSTGPFPGAWSPVNLNHPATFQTLAMDAELKKRILDDLDRFVRRKEYYRRVGKAWKRRYLLYGPPGTGKSSLVVAMANYLNFDIYDLELSGIQTNAELRRLLDATMNQSILVVKDIDCTIQLQDRTSETGATSMNPTSTGNRRQDQVTLSEFLNFIDGLWSSCDDERIIVFTTNHIEKLDPALLRPGSMDLHVPMSYCTPCEFRLLASNYLGIDHHDLFDQIESLITTERVTPTEVAEQLMKSDEPRVALGEMVSFLLITRGKRMKKSMRRKFISLNWLKRMEVVKKKAASVN
ncbi:hypothetical protein BT93_J1649 [Corymbia citriodora subsp. variegata]|nr:hypothetical protein BT93_J1649 [Corymbia citriodora subsp. variegata]